MRRSVPASNRLTPTKARFRADGALLLPAARRLGLQATATVDLGAPEDFRPTDDS